MPWTAAAIVGGALIGGAASKSASKTQAASADRAGQLAHEQYLQTREDQMPWLEAGEGSLDIMSPGIQPGHEFNRSFTLKDFVRDPGYQFRMGEGIRGIEGTAASRGGLLSGATLRRLTRYNQDYASGEFQNSYNRYNTDLTGRFNRLASVAGVGQTANAALATAGNQYVDNASSALYGGANARASGYVGGANALGGGMQQLGNWYQQRQMNDQPLWYNSGGMGGSQTRQPVSDAITLSDGTIFQP
jgi:hypothetical protein